MIHRKLWRNDRRGAVAVVVAAALPALLATAGLAVDLGIRYREQTRLQLAADAAALGAGRLLAVSTATQSDFQAAALLEARAVTSNRWIGSLSTPIAVSVTASTKVVVTLTSTADLYLTLGLGIAAPSLTATATAARLSNSSPCTAALSPSASPGIQVDNSGSITASGCGVFSNSTAAQSIYLDSGTISGTSVGAAGGIYTSSSGSNTLSPSPGNAYSASVSDPNASLTAPTAGSCNYNSASFTSYGTYSFTQAQNVFCGNTTIGGNGSTASFAAGIYYVVNGSLTFNNASITQATGVTFVLTGSAPGGFNWTNSSSASSAMTAPTSGSTAGILVWQKCPSSGAAGASSFAGGSSLQISGQIYMPCGELDMSNNAAITTSSGGSSAVIASKIYVTGSASLSTSRSSASASGQASSQLALTN